VENIRGTGDSEPQGERSAPTVCSYGFCTTTSMHSSYFTRIRNIQGYKCQIPYIGADTLSFRAAILTNICHQTSKIERTLVDFSLIKPLVDPTKISNARISERTVSSGDHDFCSDWLCNCSRRIGVNNPGPYGQSIVIKMVVVSHGLNSPIVVRSSVEFVYNLSTFQGRYIVDESF